MKKYYFFISNEVINNIEHESRELCANLKLDRESRLIVGENTIVYGEVPDQNSRASCSVQRYSSIIFHTHPKTSYSIPSVEDITKVFRHKIIRTSVIATYWGIFQIVKFKEFNITDELQIKIKEIIDTINIISVNPEYKKLRGSDKAKGINKNMPWNLLTNQNQIKEWLKILNVLLNNNGKIIFGDPFIYIYK